MTHKMHSSSEHLLTKTTLLLLGSSLAILTQAWTPVTTWGMTYTFQEGRSLIINGGSNNTDSVSQTFSIDLSTAWDTSAPAFTRLPDGPNDYKHASTMLKDGQNWFVLSNGTGYQYNIPTAAWKSLGNSPYVSRERGLPATTDPNTGYLYIPNAIINGTTQMFQYDVSLNLLKGLPMEPTLNTLVSYSAAWSSQANQLLAFGGATSGTNTVHGKLYIWSPSGGWSVPVTKGDIPTPRRSHCMVSAEGGAKMILFGGLTDQSNSVLSDVYIYDTATLTWTKGTDAGPSIARAEMACAVNKDLLVIWGGGGVNTAVTTSITVVYNWKSGKWQTHYSPIASSWDDDESGPNGSRSNKGAIIGGVIGALVVLGLIIGFILHRRKKTADQANVPQDDHKVETSQQPLHQNQHQHQPQCPETQNQSYAPAPVGLQQTLVQEPWQQQQQHHPYQQQQQQGQQPIIFSQAPYTQVQAAGYTPYQPPIIQDLSQHQQTPQIYQPPMFTTASYEPMVASIVPSPSLEYATARTPQPEIYHPHTVSSEAIAAYGGGGSTVGQSSPVSKPMETSTPQTPPRLTQNPHYAAAVPDAYKDDGFRRDPQGF
ncbi:hypothetical protein BGZ94_003391 [Podila epigama]|nr:hypothetical protein BGZ94_003391 [Podila epigama]